MISDSYIVPSVTDADSDGGSEDASSYSHTNLAVERIAIVSSLGLYWVNGDQSIQGWYHIADTIINDCYRGSWSVHLEVDGAAWDIFD